MLGFLHLTILISNQPNLQGLNKNIPFVGFFPDERKAIPNPPSQLEL